MKCDELIEKIKQADDDYRLEIEDVLDAFAELKARIQLDDDEMAGFLQLEEECGGGDLRNYIAELKQKLHDVEDENVELKHRIDVVTTNNLRLSQSIYIRVNECDCLKRKLHDAEMRADLAEAAETERYIAHLQCKRCEAMAKWCEAMRGHYLSYEEPKWFWYREWSERWLSLAEHYKEVSK